MASIISKVKKAATSYAKNVAGGAKIVASAVSSAAKKVGGTNQTATVSKGDPFAAVSKNPSDYQINPDGNSKPSTATPASPFQLLAGKKVNTFDPVLGGGNISKSENKVETPTNFSSTSKSTSIKKSGSGSSSQSGSDVALSPGQFGADTFVSNGVTYDSKGNTVSAPKLKSTEQSTMLKQGTSGANVLAIQKQLGITQDGIFGPQTKSALMAFQEANGLAVDGIAGPQTLSALQKSATSNSIDGGGSSSAVSVSGPRTNSNTSSQGVTTMNTGKFGDQGQYTYNVDANGTPYGNPITEAEKYNADFCFSYRLVSF